MSTLAEIKESLSEATAIARREQRAATRIDEQTYYQGKEVAYNYCDSLLEKLTLAGPALPEALEKLEARVMEAKDATKQSFRDHFDKLAASLEAILQGEQDKAKKIGALYAVSTSLVKIGPDLWQLVLIDTEGEGCILNQGDNYEALSDIRDELNARLARMQMSMIEGELRG